MLKYDALKTELRDYYSRNTRSLVEQNKTLDRYFQLLDAYFDSHPKESVMLHKAAQFEILAENFTPVIFKNSPFFSEMGLKWAESYGTNPAPGNRLRERNSHLFTDISPENARNYFTAGSKFRLHECGLFIDVEHHCFPYSNVIDHGLEYYYQQAEEALPSAKDQREMEFLTASMRSLAAVKKISERFAEAAKNLLPTAATEIGRKYLEQMASAGHVPWRKPQSFYEGLLTIWFLHEVCASMEGIGMGVIGHPDKALIKLYEKDLADGRTTEGEAFDLICRFLLYIDNKQDFSLNLDKLYIWGEQCGTLILGGSHPDGAPICNDLSMMFLDAHHELGLVYPKMHCRICRKTPQEFLVRIARDFMAGRSIISFLNDESIIPAQVAAGKSPEDAAGYVAGGCWEIIIEGKEHAAGANCYYSLPRALDFSIHESAELEAETNERFDKVDSAPDFESFYGIVMNNTIRSIRNMCRQIKENGAVDAQVMPAPFFSACLDDCLTKRRDFKACGGRYNPHGLPLSGFSTFTNSLLAVKALCYDSKRHPLSELLQAVRSNWMEAENLRLEATAAPHFGDGEEETARLVNRIINDIHNGISDLETEHGGHFQLGIYNYQWEILRQYAESLRATPDGRVSGSYVSQGLTPSRLAPAPDITTMIRSCASLQLDKTPANSVVTVSVLSTYLNENIFVSLIRTFLSSGIGMLQINCLSKAQLEDAVAHPERHQDLIVRLYGFSARFVKLPPEMQLEFMSRTVY